MHKSKILTKIISYFLIFSIFLVCYNGERCRASEQNIYVDDDQRYPDEADGSLYNPFYSIQDAINAAQDGDTIKILPGNYYGDLVIDKSITITTEDMDNTPIYSGTQNAYMIDITAADVSLEGLTIRDNTATSHRKAVIHISSDADVVKIINSLIDHSKNGYGIDIDGSDNIVIKNNIINDTRGINAVNSNFLTIDDNCITNCSNYPALKLVSSNGNNISNNLLKSNIYGIYSNECSDNSIYNNTITGNSNSGIIINGGSNNNFENNNIYDNTIGINLGSSDGIILENTIYDNGIGISIGGSGYTIRDNSFYNSTSYGIYAKSGSNNNIIFNNSFTNKIGSHASDKGSNQWENGNLGNYWDDFYGPDPNNNNNTISYNIINVPDVYKYRLGGVTDNYPKGIYQTQPEISNPSPANLEEGVDRRPRLSVVVTDPDPPYYTESLDVYFYYILNSTSNLIGFKRDVESGSRASISFSSTIEGKNAVYPYAGLGYDYIGVWYVEVEDSYSRITSPEWIFTTVTTPVDNKKPIVDISVPEEYMVGGEVHAQINDSIRFDASNCNDPDGEIIFYKWGFGYETSVINEVFPTHSFKSEGTYEVNLVVIDDNGSSNTSVITVKIEGDYNLPPLAEANGHYSGITGQSIYFIGSGSEDPNTGDILTYHWNFGDGETSTVQNPTHQYSTAGNHTVTLTVTDQNGEKDTDTTYALIKSKSTEESPGYEIILTIIAMLVVSIILRKKKK
jgi:parallel beta-helix repeat protein